MPIFNKAPLNHQELLQVLINRGLICTDKEKVLQNLKHISYYRFSRYARHFYQDLDSDNPLFKHGTHYEDIWSLYLFDRKLRLLTLDAIERIEVAVRTTLSDLMCLGPQSGSYKINLPFGSHWFMDTAFYHDPKFCKIFCKKIERETGKYRKTYSNDPCSYYYKHYDKPSLPPSWIVMEFISMGKWTHALAKLHGQVQKMVADQYDIHPRIFVSWLASLTWTRNIAAHHGMLWNRLIERPPMLPKPITKYCPDFSSHSCSYYATACICQTLLKRITQKTSWAKKLKDLFLEYPTVNSKKMGFIENWYTDPWWDIA